MDKAKWKVVFIDTSYGLLSATVDDGFKNYSKVIIIMFPVVGQSRLI